MIARWLYSLCLYLLTPVAMLYLLKRARRQPDYRQHWDERWARYDTPRPADGEAPIWLHAASVGETRAALPLVRALRERHPGRRFLITCITPTGRATARELLGDAVEIVYLPYDYPDAVARFLARYRPEFGLVLETEVWPNLIAACRRRHLPLFLVNARLSDKSFRGYSRLRPLMSPAFAGFAGILAQHQEDADRLTRLGARDVVVTGNLKFDNVPPADVVQRGYDWRRALGDRPVLLLASSRDGEEALWLEALARQTLPENLLLVIVPRHPQRFDQVATLLAERGLPTVRRSGWNGHTLDPATRVVLGDSMGEMAAWYALADVAVMGGSLLEFGCQNLIEACAVGTPVLVGPSTFNFAEVVRAALEVNAAWQGKDVDAVAARALRLLRDATRRGRMRAAGLAFAGIHRGATQRVLAVLESRLGTEQPGR
ncbi:lipid IV(A) 3-deoxy-D-manno-octulosonic acid transferase [Chitiniphilus eburneus]|uniref:3-deoxy-D-manno-octulosonic acid transferase n=1 Tax=Chitiniphilus eburneus TaxID=2571148 RepID=A0A4U0PKJ2_9NEIS|nr:lipid IV(A) 3-deoxy-D-manno-octulosonic acid transferase [Chitiniphilus eburneus]TJZ68613.1 3-deoxy-D-manno-octulosonic acid transferase [Chitiniphilus eburneus]